MATTKDQIREHLQKKGCIPDSTNNAFLMEHNGGYLRVVLKERVFRIERNTLGKDGYFRFRRIASGTYKHSSIKDGKFI